MGLIDFSLGDIGQLFKDIREAITGKGIEDPNKRAEIEYKLSQLEFALKQGQIEINKAEASNPNWFVAGWRPFIGWIGGFALGYQFIFQPLIIWGTKIAGYNIQPPSLETGMLFNLILAMLGLGGFRTLEKMKGVQDRH
jgi:hypothetical protein